MFFDHGYYMGGMHTLWWILWLVLLIVLVYAVSSPDRRRRRQGKPVRIPILQRRLASGEITPEAYEKAKALLDRDVGSR